MVGNLKIWWRLVKVYARMDLLFFLRDTRECVGWILCDAAMSAASITGMYLLSQRFDGFGGFSQAELLFMLGWAVIASGIYSLLFTSNNIGYISRIIGRGQLDHVLIQPVPLHVHFLSAGFAPLSGCGSFITGAALTVYAAAGLGLAPGVWWWPAALLLLGCTAAVQIAAVFIVSTTAFWAPYAAEEIAGEVTGLFASLTPYPLGGMPRAVQLVLCTVLPVGVTAWLPASILLGKTPAWGSILLVCATTACFVCLAVLLFKKGMKYYAKYSCPRYSGFGR